MSSSQVGITVYDFLVGDSSYADRVRNRPTSEMTGNVFFLAPV